MALTNIQQDVLSEIQKLAAQMVSAKGEFTKLIGMWGNEFPSPPTTADLSAYPEFAHITQTELTDAAAALLAVNTALGEFSTANSNVVKLLKIVSGVPE